MAGAINQSIVTFFDQAHAGTLVRDTNKYEEPLYVKYLTPVEQVRELADFIAKVNDMTTLTA